MPTLTLPQAYQLAVQLQQAGQWQRAEEIYQQILQADPQLHEVWYARARLFLERGDIAQAALYIEQAIKLAPTRGNYYNDWAILLNQLGNTQAAIHAFSQAVQLTPEMLEYRENHAKALALSAHWPAAMEAWREICRLSPHSASHWFSLAEACDAAGEPQATIEAYRRACELKPDFLEAYNNLGIVLQKQNDFKNAVAAYERALSLKPELVPTRINLAMAYQKLGDRESAIRELRIVRKYDPLHTQAAAQLAALLVDCDYAAEAQTLFAEAAELNLDNVWLDIAQGNWHLKQGRHTDALTYFDIAISKQPTLAEAHFGKAGVLHWMQKYREAAKVCQAAIQQGIEYAPLLNSFAVALFHLEKPTEAIRAQREAIQLDPNNASFRFNLAQFLSDQEQFEESIQYFESAIAIDPTIQCVKLDKIHAQQMTCDWSGIEESTNELRKGWHPNGGDSFENSLAPFAWIALPLETSASSQLACAELKIRYIKSERGPLVIRSGVTRNALANAKLKIGYLSADFHEHATCYLLAELLEQHDRKELSIHAYSYGKRDESVMRQRIVASVDKFVDVRLLSDLDAAKRIAADEVDILVDLKGHTKYGRMGILSYRPAPVQAHYLGYPGTTGSDFIDYLLADTFVIPPDQRVHYTEQVVYLPGCYQVNDSKRQATEHSRTRAEYGLPEQGFVFCSFNNNYKITEPMFNVWMQLLRDIPNSVLWLLEGNRFAATNLRREISQRGVAEQRVVFAPFVSTPDHLARYRVADLFLDTFPVNAHTTASDALWMGCPVLTMAGETFVSRVAGSLLNTLQLPELITTTWQDYATMALRLATQVDFLNSIRNRLLQNRETSGLFNAARFARNIERAYRQMWSLHVAGETPRSFAVEES
jgi:protein O-GlcNAc transferase